MTESRSITTDLLLQIARRRSLALDERRAGAIRPAVESLLGRLAALAPGLPPDATPPPERVPPPSR